MAVTDINNEDQLVQTTFANYLHDKLGWESVYAYNSETFGANGTLGRNSEREIVLAPQLRAAITALNPHLPSDAIEAAIQKITGYDFARSTLQHNKEFYRWILDGVPVEYKDEHNEQCSGHARVIDFRDESKKSFCRR
jgi:type I restriction enzyme, R subunit